MRKTFVPCFIIMVMILIGNLHFTQAEEPQSTAAAQNIDNNIDKDGVALSLIYRGGFGPIPQAGVRLIVWNDGRVLFGKGGDSSSDNNNREYVFGKVDQKTIKEMQDRIRKAFRVADTKQYIGYILIDAPTYNLQVLSEDGPLHIETGGFSGVYGGKPNRSHVVLKESDSIDGKEMREPEFHEIWHTIKAEVIQLGEKATAKNAVPVKTVGERGQWRFTVNDAAGNVLAEYPPKTTLVVKIDSISIIQSNLMPPKDWRVEATVVRQTSGNFIVKSGEKVSFLIHSPIRDLRKSNTEAIGKEFKIRYESDFRNSLSFKQEKENYAGKLTVVPVE